MAVWPIDMSHAWQGMLYPERTVVTVRFPNPYPGIDHCAANEYLLERASTGDRVAAFGLQEDIAYTIRMLHEKDVVALKMYYFYPEPPARTILETFSRDVLEECQLVGKPIILHLPRPLAQCVDELVSVAKAFPELKVILAHLGLPRGPAENVRRGYERIAEYSHVYADTAMVTSTVAIEMALSVLGPGRVMFGSDEPLNLVRAVPYVHPILGDRLAAEFPYHWADPVEMRQSSHFARGATHLHWAALTALREALQNFCGLSSTVVQQVFSETAKGVFRLSLGAAS